MKTKQKLTFKYHYQYKDFQFEIETAGYKIDNKEGIVLNYESIEEHINDLNRFIRADVQTIEINNQIVFSNVSTESDKIYVQNINYYDLSNISSDKIIYFSFNKRKLYMKNYMAEYRKKNPDKIKEIKAKSYRKNK